LTIGYHFKREKNANFSNRWGPIDTDENAIQFDLSVFIGAPSVANFLRDFHDGLDETRWFT